MQRDFGNITYDKKSELIIRFVESLNKNDLI